MGVGACDTSINMLLYLLPDAERFGQGYLRVV